MTPKDIRDIAAYTGCTYSVEVFDQNPEKGGWPVEWYTKQGTGKGLLFRLGEITADSYESEQSIRNLKLQLRPIASLTDEEAYTCYDLAFGSDATLGKPHGVNRDEEKLEVYAYDRADYGRRDLSIWLEDGQMAATGYRHYVQDLYSPIWSPSSLIAHLQSIGIYIPGTIDEKYVQLIP